MKDNESSTPNKVSLNIAILRKLGRFVVLSAIALVVMATSLITVNFSLGTKAASAATTAACTFRVDSSTPGSVASVSGTSVLIGVVAGQTIVNADCNASANPLALAEASLLAASVIPANVTSQLAEVGSNAFVKVPSSNTTGCPGYSPTQSCVDFSLPLPANFAGNNLGAGVDPNAQCPPSQTEANMGLFGCAIIVLSKTLSQIATTLAIYANTPNPQGPPTVALGISGNTVNLSDAAGATTLWGYNSTQDIQAIQGGTTAIVPPSTATTCFNGSLPMYGYVPSTDVIAELQNQAGGPIMNLSAGGYANVQISNICYLYNKANPSASTIYSPKLSGTLTINPTTLGLTTGNYNVYLCESIVDVLINSNDNNGVCLGSGSYELGTATLSVSSTGTLSTTSVYVPPTTVATTTSGVVANATSAQTGEPFIGESLIAGVGVVAGLGLVLKLRRSKRRFNK